LKRIAYRLNTNAFHFDTEIIIQLLNAGQRIVELPIPTYYGTEICRVNGVKYAVDVLLATVRNVAHRSGLLYQRRFDPVSEQENAHYDVKVGYASSHQYALDAIPDGASVIDIGAGPGGIAKELVAKCSRVAVVDQYTPIDGGEPGIVVLTQDLDDEITFDVGDYEYLLLLDVIEHLKKPEQFLRRLRAQFDYTPRTLILTTPNIAFVAQRLMLLFGQFNYGKAGILDLTHTRLFTFRSLRHLLDDAGLRIVEIRGVPAPFPKVLGNGLIGRVAVAVNQLLIRVSKTLFSYQIFVVAESTPDIDFILDDDKRRAVADRRH
jgi:2-polyprenyl-3-methyl-5-hydroxy-6-metoxy-1,4-benzoquinol methylase